MVCCRLRRDRRRMAELRIPFPGPQSAAPPPPEEAGLREAAPPFLEDTKETYRATPDRRPARDLVGGWQRYVAQCEGLSKGRLEKPGQGRRHFVRLRGRVYLVCHRGRYSLQDPDDRVHIGKPVTRIRGWSDVYADRDLTSGLAVAFTLDATSTGCSLTDGVVSFTSVRDRLQGGHPRPHRQAGRREPRWRDQGSARVAPYVVGRRPRIEAVRGLLCLLSHDADGIADRERPGRRHCRIIRFPAQSIVRARRACLPLRHM